MKKLCEKNIFYELKKKIIKFEKRKKNLKKNKKTFIIPPQ